MDRSLEWLRVLAPRGWLALGMLALAPAFVSGVSTTTSLAVSIGGVLLAYHAFRTVGEGIDRVVSAVIAWDHVRPVWEAPAARASEASLVAGEGEDRGSGARGEEDDSQSQPVPLLEARQVEYRYPGRAQPVLRSTGLDVRAGEWILLEGPSGGGKSTLAAVLAGLRDPQSGLVLFRGLDRASVGDAAWRRRVLLAPQFHQNHLVLGTLAFNLLLGRRWPPQPADLQEADAVCRSLGLGTVLDEMPGGLFQIVGETGWQLSQGQRSRVFVARALLQRPDVLILDESVDALDPETLSAVLACLRERAPTLMLIAHP
jgi:ATP-binding cassette subfamily B protein